MEETNNWTSPKVKEAPCWRDGMTPEEYEIEREYYYRHLNDVKSDTNKPS